MSEEMKYTKPPLEAALAPPEERGSPSWCVLDSERRIVAGVYGHDQAALVYARLFAAAPDLLEALQEMGDWLAYGLNKPDGEDPTDADFERAKRVATKGRAAINKALGI